MSRVDGGSEQVDVTVRTLGCPICGTLVKPGQDEVEHPQLGRIHAKCNRAISWKGVPARSPNMMDPEDIGRGYDEWDS